jgi:PEP-CTERM motif
MKMKRMVLIALTVLLTAGLAAATPITGAIIFNGGVTLNNPVGTATWVTGWDAKVFASSLPGVALAGSTVNFKTPWVFSPINTGAPIANFWSVGVYTFSLASWTINNQDAAQLSIDGIGTISASGFDPTPGTWHFSTQTNDVGGVFSFSASSAAVPEPASLLLLTAGIGGLGLFRRRK